MVIPPSTAFIMYSLVAGGASISSLFLGGYLVGSLWALGIMVVAYVIAKRHNYPTVAKAKKEKSARFCEKRFPVYC